MTPSVIASLLVVVLLTGCKPCGGGSPATPPAVTSPAPSAAVQPSTPPAPAGILDAMTGKATMEAGQRAAQKIRAISRQEQQDLDKALAP